MFSSTINIFNYAHFKDSISLYIIKIDKIEKGSLWIFLKANVNHLQLLLATPCVLLLLDWLSG
jgi:hypothetical protein